tara:strand:- start:177 stop:560 length:384 start_codon:yes stop_codon:yes gene_type:complete
MERLWCPSCQHGVEGIDGAQCPICVSKSRQNIGVLLTPEAHKKVIADRGRAIKILRKDKAPKPYKTLKDVEKEIYDRVKKEVLEELKGTTTKTVEVKPTTIIKKKGPGRPKKSPVSSGTSTTLKGDK